MNKERLLNVAKALRESPNPEGFTMEQIKHVCGTPACALGHYAYRADLQSVFELRPSTWGFFKVGEGGDEDWLKYSGPEVCEHFDITPSQADALFQDSDYDDENDQEIPCGCGGAQTAIEAAEYIERFVAEHE